LSKTSDPRASIIIVNWNGDKFLKDCLFSLQNQSFRNFEVIFVDNASTDSSLLTAKQIAAGLSIDIKFIGLASNLGFAGGNNEGLKYTSGIYIALLNPDTVAEKYWLKNLVEALESHPDAGICASKLIVDGENVIDSAGDGYSTFGHAFKRGEGKPPDDYSESEYVFGACAGAAIYRREMIEKIGLFDEDIFLIFEDADLNLRAQLSGWKCFYVSDAVVYHKVGGSIKKIGPQSSYYVVRNDRIMKIKNLPRGIVFRKLPLLFLGEIIWFFYYLINGRIAYYHKANIDVLKNFHIYLRKRREIMNLRRVSDRYMQSMFTSGFKLYGLRRIRRYLAL
jgi:GT2 family glycosyltransferase